MLKLSVLFQDDYLMVVDKPPGLVVTPNETSQDLTLAEILQSDFGIDIKRGGVVHRLDKDTSGIILVAKTLDSFEFLQNQFKDREVKKQYLALAHGFINQAGSIDAAIARNPQNREKFTVLDTGREAQTNYQPLKKLKMEEKRILQVFEGFNKIQFKRIQNMRYGEFTLVSCLPKTGRTHQIRVHLKYINHPIVSDEKYGGRKVTRLDRRWCPRQFLHAASIEFRHPSGKMMKFESPMPKDLDSALSNLTD